MASLRDTITKSIGTGGKQLVRNASGQLVEQAVPISQLAGQQGMTAPPTTPGGATAIGATPDSAKMAGTPNQMQSALRQNTDQINTTQEAQADKRYRSTLTADEQARKEKAEKLAPLSETHAKVQGWVDKQVQLAATTGGATTPTLATGTLKATDPTKQAEVDAAMQKAATGDAAAIAQLVTLTGKPSSEIQQAAKDAATAGANNAAQAYATAIGDVGIENILPPGMDVAQLAGLLGMTPDQVQKMSLGDLDTAVANLGQTTAQTDEAANSALLGSAERAEMAERSKELSTSGAAAIDAQLTDLGAQLESADQITFLGQTGTISDLLSDKGISDAVTKMMNDGSWEKLPDTDPLKQFITKYKDVLTKAAAGVETAAKGYEEVQTANKSALTFGNAVLSPQLAQDLLGFDPSKPTADKVDPSKSNLLGWLKGNPNAEQIVSELNGNPTLAKELNGLNAGELSKLDPPNGERWKIYKDSQAVHEKWKNVNPADPDSILEFLAGSAGGGQQLKGAVAAAYKLRKAGLPAPQIPAGLDEDPKDGVIDAPSKLSSYIQKNLGPSSLRDVITGFTPTEARVKYAEGGIVSDREDEQWTKDQGGAIKAPSLPQITPELLQSSVGPAQESFMELLSKGNAHNNVLDVPNIGHLVHTQGVTLADIIARADAAGLPPSARNNLQKAVEGYRTAHADTIANEIVKGGPTADTFTKLRSRAAELVNDPNVNQDKLQERLRDAATKGATEFMKTFKPMKAHVVGAHKDMLLAAGYKEVPAGNGNSTWVKK